MKEDRLTITDFKYMKSIRAAAYFQKLLSGDILNNNNNIDDF